MSQFSFLQEAAGITESDGSVSLKKLFTYDIVAGNPGFASAKMSVKVLNESLGYAIQMDKLRKTTLGYMKCPMSLKLIDYSI